MNSDSFDGNNAHPFVVSYDLLQLFKWIFEHEEESLKKLIHKCVRNGLQENLQKKTTTVSDNDPDLQQIVVDFLALTEILLAETVHEQQVATVVHRSMIPAINHIDATVCDKLTVAQSIAKAAATPGNHSAEDLKQILCKELLKRWKPTKRVVS
ncbi:hypothetical protein H0X48_01195 [Candidatus Dependentiae bacterium]|nr:hypothetical protein [Candidatus Dependentiae bacterium]